MCWHGKKEEKIQLHDRKRYEKIKSIWNKFLKTCLKNLQDLNFALYSLERDNHMTSVLAVPKKHFWMFKTSLVYLKWKIQV